MGLRDGRVAAALEAFDEVELPQGPGEIEGFGHHPADQLAKLRHTPRAGQGEMTDVPLEIEIAIVRPDGVGEPERDLGDPLAEPRDEPQPGVDVLEEALELGRLAVEDDRRADVHVDRAPLREQARHVGRRESLVHRTARDPIRRALAFALAAALLVPVSATAKGLPTVIRTGGPSAPGDAKVAIVASD